MLICDYCKDLHTREIWIMIKIAVKSISTAFLVMGIMEKYLILTASDIRPSYLQLD